MTPKKLLAVKEQEQPPILSKNPRKEVLVWPVFANRMSLMYSLQRSDLSLIMVTPKATVHRFAVARVRVRRRIVGALDLIVRRGAFPFPEGSPKQSNKPGKSNGKDRKPDSEKPRILFRDSTLAGHQAWILPGMHSRVKTLDITSLTLVKDWTYTVFPRAEVFRMPLPDLVDQLRLGLQQVNQKARAWEDRYVSPETGEFIVRSVCS